MKIITKLIRLHKILFFGAVLVTFCAVGMDLFWNSFLADLINKLDNASFFETRSFIGAFCIILLLAGSEFISSFLAAYTCELFAHEIRMGYAGFYLHSDIRTLSGLNAGEEQSAMQNELSEISSYLNENLFSLMKQLISFVFTVVFLWCQNPKLTLVTILPVLPLIGYCAVSGKVIKGLAEHCQENRKQINGLFSILLDLFPVIWVYDAYGLMRNTMNQRLAEWQSANVKKERIAAGLMSLSGVLSFVPLLLLLGYGVVMVIKGEITVGIFYIFINLSGNVSGFLQNMPNIYAGFKQFCAAVGRVEKKLIF